MVHRGAGGRRRPAAVPVPAYRRRGFQSTFGWPVFAELRRLLRARQHGDRTRSYQGRHISLHVPESGDIGLVLPNLRLRLAPDTFTALEADLLAQLEHPAAAAALAELAALYGDL
ncbi:hypothetical protein [Serratia marcescens]|uniref:hypothetical protein n=1 Tax=Serratia marcescens TaxID=615 RepID=UPI00148E089F|nr:hypothetical protein [Serratia marcescens]